MTSKRNFLAAMALAAFATALFAQQPSAAAVKDPGAMAALDRMGAFLRTLKSYQINSATSMEKVLESGQKITYGGTADLLVRQPDRLRAEIVGDRKLRTYFYDGKSFTLWAPRVGYYATVPAPATIGELADRLTDKYDIELPLVDLFRWGTEKSSAGDIRSAMDAGPSQVDGTSCEHYAFRQDGLDWQVWIQNGDFPLPRKLVLTSTTDEARPQYTSVLTWNLAPAFNEPAFTFVPPKDAKKITIMEAGSTGGSSQ